MEYVAFRVEPTWRHLDEPTKDRARTEFIATLEDAVEAVWTRPYSTVGTRADSDFLLWIAAESLQEVQDLHGRLNRTVLRAHSAVSHGFLGLARPSRYTGGHEHDGGHGSVGRIEPGDGRYLIVYPFTKTHMWYQLPFEQRREIMGEHFRVGHEYPGIRIHTAYSFGLDDHEFTLAFECDDLAVFSDMVERLRGARQRVYTQRDTPILTAIRRTPREVVDLLG